MAHEIYRDTLQKDLRSYRRWAMVCLVPAVLAALYIRFVTHDSSGVLATPERVASFKDNIAGIILVISGFGFIWNGGIVLLYRIGAIYPHTRV